ncbi:MAG: hypothetical protein ABIH11_04125 [Candidatus Altiarchaeota archaeon]
MTQAQGEGGGGMSRRMWIQATAGAAAATALTIGGIQAKKWWESRLEELRKSAFDKAFEMGESHEARDLSKYSMKSAMRVLANPRSQADMEGASKRVIELMQEKNIPEVIRGYGGNVYTAGGVDLTGDALTRRMDEPILCHRSSKVFQHVMAEADPNHTLIGENVEWMVLTPNVVSDSRGIAREEAGLYAGGRIIYIDTSADHGVRDSVELPGIAAHEAKHAANKGQMSRLENEKTAHETQWKTAAAQIERLGGDANAPETLIGMAWMCKHRIDTANYLLGETFEKDFHAVYPGEMIHAGALLEGRVTREVLERHSQVDTGNAEMDGELRDAVSIARIVHDKNLNDAATELRTIAVSDESERRRENAKSALSFLFPNAMKMQSTPGYTIRTDRKISFGFGRTVAGEDGKVVFTPGIPSLKELMDSVPQGPVRGEIDGPEIEPDGEIRPLEFESRDRNQAAMNRLVGKARDADDAMAEIIDDFNKVLRQVGSPQGCPEGFKYCGYMMDRRGDTIVYYQHPKITVPMFYADTGEPVMSTGGTQIHQALTKVDLFSNGVFKESKFVFRQQMVEQDMRKVPPKYMREMR